MDRDHLLVPLLDHGGEDLHPRIVARSGGMVQRRLICGNDAGAKNEARAILGEFGWEVDDLGGVEAARAIEPLCILWCIPGFLENRWSHALKRLKA